MYTSKPNTVLILSTSKWTFVHPQTFVVDIYTGRCHHKCSHRTLPSHLGVGGNVQSSDICTYIIGRCNRTIVHARSLYIYVLVCRLFFIIGHFYLHYLDVCSGQLYRTLGVSTWDGFVDIGTQVDNSARRKCGNWMFVLFSFCG